MCDQINRWLAVAETLGGMSLAMYWVSRSPT